MFDTPTTIVPGVGPIADCTIAIVGEAPGSTEARLKKPFVGPAGQLLDDCLRSAGLNRQHIYITNVIKEQPPYNDISTFINLDKRIHVTPEASQYINLLRDELQHCTANIIIAAGAIPLYVLCGIKGITKWRGSILESNLLPGRKVLPMIHPAAALRQYLYKYPIIFDLKRAKEQSAFPEIRRVDRQLIIEPSLAAVYSFLNSIEHFTTIDIEVLNEEVSCISMGNKTLGFMSIPFVNEFGDCWTPKEETIIWTRIAQICASPHISKLGQNIIFDATFLYQRYGILTNNLDCTMIAQGILYPDFPKGLDFLTSIYTEEPYYKDDGKKWFKFGGNFVDLNTYNAKDSAVLPDIFTKQLTLLKAQNNHNAYLRQRDLIEPLIFMTARGIRTDHDGLRAASTSAATDIQRLSAELDEAVGFHLNPNSPKQLKEYFYGTLNHKPYVNRKTGGVSTDRDALKRLARKGENAAKIILELRRIIKLKSTYLDMRFDSDSRLRCAFNPVGTTSGRLSSSETIFGTGGNMQNLPVSFRQYLLVDENYIGYQIDLSQAENRVVAYIAPDATMIDAFETGKDVHRLTASLIFNKPYEEISDEAGSCSIGGGIYSERFWGKKANHGLNYDLGFRTFALYYEIAESDARFIVERYHQAYPGVRQLHAWIRHKLSQDRTLENCFGRRRLFLDRWGDELFKNAYSYIPQSTVAEKLNIDGVLYSYYSGRFPELELLNQVHDSIWFQIPRSVPLPRHAEILWDLKTRLEQPLQWKTRSFTIPADIEGTTSNFGKHSDSNPNGLTKLKASTYDELLTNLKAIVEA